MILHYQNHLSFKYNFYDVAKHSFFSKHPDCKKACACLVLREFAVGTTGKMKFQVLHRVKVSERIFENVNCQKNL